MNIAYENRQPTHSKINSGTQSISNNDTINDAPATLPINNIHVSCRNLKKLDVGSDSDPMVVMFVPTNNQNIEVSRTEVVWNNNNPQFVKFFQVMYVFQAHQPLRFNVYDVDSEKTSLQSHQLIGYVDTDVQTDTPPLNLRYNIPSTNIEEIFYLP